jgi:hypothetical protein
MEPTVSVPVLSPHLLTPRWRVNTFATEDAGANKFFEDFGVWKEAPVLTGSTKYEPLPDVKNIMITGGAGFM